MSKGNGGTLAFQVTVGTGFCGLLGIAFIVLKLCGVIDWSWWLVLLPIYGPATLLVAFLVAAFALLGFVAFLATKSGGK